LVELDAMRDSIACRGCNAYVTIVIDKHGGFR